MIISYLSVFPDTFYKRRRLEKNMITLWPV